METFKPTISKPVNQQSKNLEKNFKSTIQKSNINLDESEELLTEKEQSLKKKIFSLSKMEALVFSDPKLSAIYDEMMAENDETFIYGYHANESILNSLFNSYILNSSKYLQKYKQAIPTKKKRRDKSGIEQLKKVGEKKMEKNNQNEELTSINVEETTTAGSAGGSASYVGYAGPAAWSKSGKPAINKPIWTGGALIGESQYLVNPSEFEKLYNFLNEENDIDYIQKNSEEYGSLNNMNKDNIDIIKKDIKTKHLDEKQNNELNELYDKFEDANNEALKISKEEGVAQHVNELPNGKYEVSDWFDSDQTIKSYENGRSLNEKAVSKSQQRFMGMVKAVQNGDLNPNEVGEKIKKAAQTMKSKDVEDFASTKHKDLPEKIDETLLSIEDTYSYEINNGNSKENAAEIVLDILTGGNFKTWAAEKINKFIKKIIKYMESKITENMNLNEEQKEVTKVEFLVNETNPNDIDLFAYFPEDNYDDEGILKTAYSHVGQHSSCHPRYAEASRPATVEEYTDLKNELEGIGYNLEIVNNGGVNENIDNEFQEDQINDEPEDNDCFIQDNTMGGYDVSCDGNFIGNYNEMDDALNAVKEWKTNNNFFPNTWFVSDHGNVSLIDDEGNSIKEEQSMVEPNPSSMSFKPTPLDQSSMERGMNSGGGSMMNEDNESNIKKNNPALWHQIQIAKKTLKMTDAGAAIMGGMSKEEARNLLKKHNIKVIEDENFDKLNEELEAYSILTKNLKMIAEDRKPSTLVMKDRLGNENQKNFKKDLQHSGTKEIINVEKELQWKDQQTDVKDPKKITNDLEKNELKNTKGESFKNVGDSANYKGDEIPKRNLTTEEQDEVDLYRLGMQDLVYDNNPGKKFEERMKNDIGEKLYKGREAKLKFRAEAPLYNKDTQPTENGQKKNQYNKYSDVQDNKKSIKESIISGKFINKIGKKELVHFNLTEVYKLNENVNNEYMPLDFTGMVISLNENVNNFISNNKFVTDGKKVFYLKKQDENKNINNNNNDLILENFDKIQHLLNYNPKNFVDTKKIKLNKKV